MSNKALLIMDMPDKCSHCRLESCSGEGALLTYFCCAKKCKFTNIYRNEERPDWCPLTEINV